MKYLIIALFLCSNAQAYTQYNNALECTEVTADGFHEKSVAVSCVSKASIEKDKAQLKLIKLQIKKLEDEMKAERTESAK